MIKAKSNITYEYNLRVDDLGQDRDSPTENKEVSQKLIGDEARFLHLNIFKINQCSFDISLFMFNISLFLFIKAYICFISACGISIFVLCQPLFVLYHPIFVLHYPICVLY